MACADHDFSNCLPCCPSRPFPAVDPELFSAQYYYYYTRRFTYCSNYYYSRWWLLPPPSEPLSSEQATTRANAAQARCAEKRTPGNHQAIPKFRANCETTPTPRPPRPLDPSTGTSVGVGSLPIPAAARCSAPVGVPGPVTTATTVHRCDYLRQPATSEVGSRLEGEDSRTRDPTAGPDVCCSCAYYYTYIHVQIRNTRYS
ncbi:hypothetical protein B0T25DRAFT_364811 [Lasiosphaeria hispida]|uniref:Uncharacterized protein n=1 Tax=Lasiosphaeria hispida TaxID=260671 RepID=A0AAJ0H5Z1_9PEZI|nr:hypothetical protein B0T25DRAFT_364811 [Lasiosphaeria hispida]